MKTIVYGIVLVGIIMISITNCTKNNDNNNSTDTLISLLDIVSPNQYYKSDSLEMLYHGINNVWEAIISEDGLGREYIPDFDYLLIKPNSIFGIVKNDSLVLHGRIEIEGQFNNHVLFNNVMIINENLSHFIESSFVQCISLSGNTLEISTCGALSGHRTRFVKKTF